MDSIIIKAPAKINLFLEVGKKLDTGYHLIESIMQSVTLYDELTVTKADKDSFICSDISLQNDDNLVIKAKEAFFDATGLFFYTEIKLLKRIPVAAGLGGGSSDCAAMLTALNEICKKPLTDTELMKIGKKLGADVPFCLKKGLCFAEGIGEVLQRLRGLPECYFVIAIGDEKISTKQAFAKLDENIHREVRIIQPILAAIQEGDLNRICAETYNVFEMNGSLRDEIKFIMKEYSALSVLLSGSGPSVFGIYNNSSQASQAAEYLNKCGYRAYLCTPEM